MNSSEDGGPRVWATATGTASGPDGTGDGGAVPSPHGKSLRTAARWAIQTGAIPGDPVARMWGSTGLDAACAVCAKPLNRQTAMLEVEFEGSSRAWPLHVACFAAWDSERQALAAEVSAKSDMLSGPRGPTTMPLRERHPPSKPDPGK